MDTADSARVRSRNSSFFEPSSLQRSGLREFARTGEFVVRLASNREEYKKLQSLRHEVFHREFAGKTSQRGNDIDKYDEYASHLVVVKGADNIVGTYRLILGHETSNFYSHSEFNLSSLSLLPGAKIDLSRACIHQDYRSGLILNMLWRGLAGFANLYGARWLVGIPSIKTTDPSAAAILYGKFKSHNWLHSELAIEPWPHFKMAGFDDAYAAMQNAAPKALPVEIPPLMLSYFRAGAKVLGVPAFDPEFQCIDFPVALDLASIDPRFRRKYLDATDGSKND